jgi:hypothetical protein
LSKLAGQASGMLDFHRFGSAVSVLGGLDRDGLFQCWPVNEGLGLGDMRSQGEQVQSGRLGRGPLRGWPVQRPRLADIFSDFNLVGHVACSRNCSCKSHAKPGFGNEFGSQGATNPRPSRCYIKELCGFLRIACGSHGPLVTPTCDVFYAKPASSQANPAWQSGGCFG